MFEGFGKADIVGWVWVHGDLLLSFLAMMPRIPGLNDCD